MIEKDRLWEINKFKKNFLGSILRPAIHSDFFPQI